MVKGKPAGAKAPPRQKSKAEKEGASTPGEGHNSKSAEDEDADRAQAFFVHEKSLRAADAALAAAKEKRRSVVANIKKDGFLLEEFKVSEQLDTENGENTLKEQISRMLRVARWKAVPLGAQADMFDEPDRTPIVDRARMEGRRDAMQGANRKTDYAPETEMYRAYMDAYDEAQAKVVKDQLKPLSTTTAHPAAGNA